MSSAQIYKLQAYECGLLFQSLRIRAKLRQQDIAAMVGASVNTVQYWEGGVTFPKVETFKKLLEVYLRYGLFSQGSELIEARELWEKVRSEAPRLNASFDQNWFKELLAKLEQARISKADQIEVVRERRDNIPARLTSFIGRKKELAILANRLRPPISLDPAAPPQRLITLTGEGGSGKTSLALQSAREMLPAFPQGVWLVELGPLMSGSEIIQTLARTMNLKAPGKRSLLNVLTDYLREKRILLVLDNCEHLVNETAGMVKNLLEECPTLVVLATSRQVLGIAGENVLRVPLLSLPPARLTFMQAGIGFEQDSKSLLDSLLEYEAVQLLVERGRNANPVFELTGQNWETVAQLCQRLEGVPLAIELAAARLRVLTVDEINERLNDRLKVLKSSTGLTVLPRHQTIRATIEWSYDLLNRPEKMLFRRFAVFSNGWTLEAAEEICSLTGLNKDEILDWLHELVNKSLVIAEEMLLPLWNGDVKRQSRFRLLETLREYGREQLEKVLADEIGAAEKFNLGSGLELDQLQARHLLYYSSFATRYLPVNDRTITFPHKQKATEILETEHLNLGEALRWSTSQSGEKMPGPLLNAALALGVAAALMWHLGGNIQEGYHYLSRLRTQAQEAGLQPGFLYAKVCDWLGVFTFYEGNNDLSRLYINKAIALFTAMGNKEEICHNLVHLATTFQNQGDGKEAYRILQESLSLANEIGNQAIVLRIQSSLGTVCTDMGEFKEARERLENALELARKYDEPKEVLESLTYLSPVAIVQGDYETANRYLQEALLLLRKSNNKIVLSACLGNLGMLSEYRGDYTQAKLYLLEALALQRETGYRFYIAVSLNNLACLALELGNPAEAERFNEEAKDYFQKLNIPLGSGLCAIMDGELALYHGNYFQAISKKRQALSIFWDLQDRHYICMVLLDLAHLFVLNGKALNQNSQEKSTTDFVLAARLAGVITNIITELEEILKPTEQKKLEGFVETCRRFLDNTYFEQLVDEGKLLPLGKVVADCMTSKMGFP